MKRKVKPKLIIVAKELADVIGLFKGVKSTYEAKSKQIFTKTVDFYLDALKFDASKVLAGLDDEIKVLKQEMANLN